MKLFIKSMLVVALIWIAIPVQGKKPDSPAYLIVYYKMNWADGDVKYLFMSKYLIQCPDYNEHNGMAELTSFSTNLWNQFNDVIVQKIVQDEWDPTLSVRDGVHDVPEEVQEISEWSVEGGNNGEFIFYDDVDRQDSPLQAALKVRNQIIKEAKDEGYTIRQVSFLPKSGDTNGSDYDFSFYDGDRNKHLYCNISITNPLSIYEVVPYSKGEVKKEVEGHETKRSSSNNSSTSSQSSSESSETVDPRIQMSVRLVTEGDYYYNQGRYDLAIDKYNQALQLTNIPSIRKKIEDTQKQARSEFMVNATQELAHDIFTPYTIYGISYSGLTYSKEKFDPTKFTKISFQLSGIKRFINLKGEIGYLKTPNFIYGNYTGLGSGTFKLNYTDTTRFSGIFAGFGFGPNIRLFDNRLILYGTVQFNALFYTDLKNEISPMLIPSVDAGILLRFGEFGLGVSYDYLYVVLEKMRVDDTLNDVDYSKEPRIYEKVISPFNTHWNAFTLRLLFNFQVDDK